jgi:hypothetical protein
LIKWEDREEKGEKRKSLQLGSECEACPTKMARTMANAIVLVWALVYNEFFFLFLLFLVSLGYKRKELEKKKKKKKKGETDQPPSAKVNISPALVSLLTCKFRRYGIGIETMIASVKMLSTLYSHVLLSVVCTRSLKKKNELDRQIDYLSK